MLVLYNLSIDDMELSQFDVTIIEEVTNQTTERLIKTKKNIVFANGIYFLPTQYLVMAIEHAITNMFFKSLVFILLEKNSLYSLK